MQDKKPIGGPFVLRRASKLSLAIQDDYDVTWNARICGCRFDLHCSSV